MARQGRGAGLPIVSVTSTVFSLRHLHLRIHIAVVALVGALARGAIAQAPARVTPMGIWRGTSVCLVRPSPCNDESVVYRITPMKTPDSVAVDGRKIVRGEEQEMGVLGCRLEPRSAELTCTIPQGVWHFRAHNDSLTGELRHVDNSRFREVRAKRAPSQ